MKFLSRKNLATLTLVVLVSCGVVFGVGANKVWGQLLPTGSGGSGFYSTNNQVNQAIENKSEKPVADPAPAEPSAIANFIGWTLFYIASAFSWMVSVFINVLVTKVIIFNDFVNHKIVSTGWTIVRDVANNFFIVILLVIAVATTLRQPAQYQYQSALPKLLIMVVLINFSKLFTGILIDISQILTIFFANALQDNGASVILVALGLGKYYQAAWSDNTPDSLFGNWHVVTQLIFALIASVVAAVVILSLLLMFVVRIITLWFLIILSPAAFFAYAIPGGQSYFSQWWTRLTKELIVGPVAMFFLYLALFAGAIDQTSTNVSSNAKPQDFYIDGNNTIPKPNSGTDAADQAASFGSYPDQIYNFLIVIGLLVMTLVAAQTVGAEGSKFAGAGLAKLKGWQNKGVSFGKKYTLDKAKEVGKGAAIGAWTGTKRVTGVLDQSILKGKGASALGAFTDNKTGMAAAKSAAATVLTLGMNKVVKSQLEKSDKARKDKLKIAEVEMDGDKSKYTDENGNKIGDLMPAIAEAEAERDEANLRVQDLRMNNAGFRSDEASLNHSVSNRETHERYVQAANKDFEDAEKALNKIKEDSFALPADIVKAQADFDAAKAVKDTRDTQSIGYDQAVQRDRNHLNNTYTDYKNYDSAVEKVRDLNNEYDKGYTYDESKGAYFKNDGSLEDDGSVKTLKDKDDSNKLASRYKEATLSDGKTYRRATENGPYLRVNDKGEFIKGDGAVATTLGEAQKAEINGAEIKGGVYSETEGVQGGINRARIAWQASSSRGRAAKEAIKMKEMEEYKKDYANQSPEFLRSLLAQEGNQAKKQAINMALADKDGLKDSGMIEAAKSIIGTNEAMLKGFNELVNKKNAVLNHTRTDGTIDVVGLRKIMNSGKAKWSEQDLKGLNKEPKALDLMADMLGDKFETTINGMINTVADKGLIADATGKGIKERGFEGTDFAIRRAHAVYSGNLPAAFTDAKTGAVNHAKLTESIGRISNPEAFSGFEVGGYDRAMKDAIANGMSVSHFSRMNSSDKVSPTKIKEYIKMLEDVRDHGADQVTKDNAAKLIANIKKISLLRSLVP